MATMTQPTLTVGVRTPEQQEAYEKHKYFMTLSLKNARKAELMEALDCKKAAAMYSKRAKNLKNKALELVSLIYP